MNRQRDQTLLAFSAALEQKLRKPHELGVQLPDTLKGWLLARLSGINKDQRTIAYSMVGKDLNFDKVREALFMVLGQDSLPERGSRADHAHWVDEEPDYDGS